MSCSLRRGSSRLAGLLLGVLLLGGASSSSRQARAGERPLFDGRLAFAQLQRQCDFGPRVPGSPGHEAALRFLEEELRGKADRVELQTFEQEIRGKKLTLTNLVATFNPAGSKRALLCAHWDTRPTADREAKPEDRAKPIPGANDGASGVAVLLELARLLKLSPTAWQVVIVLFDGEDYGPGIEDMLLGSRYYARNFRGPKPEWGVLVDMVGAKGTRLGREGYSQRLAPQVVERIWKTAARLGVGAFEDRDGPTILDDHVPLLEIGLPCINLIDISYPYWHTLADTPDKCSPEPLEAVGKVLWAALCAEQ
jgi:hypothetical protein